MASQEFSQTGGESGLPPRSARGWLRRHDLATLQEQAAGLAHHQKGKVVCPSAIISFSNHCQFPCRHCGWRRENDGLQRYRMHPDEVIFWAREVIACGVKRLILQSGTDIAYSPEMISDMIRRIKAMGEVDITLSLGLREGAEYEQWFDCGARGYLLRFESSSDQILRQIIPNVDLGKVVEALSKLKAIGYRLGTGFVVGLMSSEEGQIAQDLEYCGEMKADLLSFALFSPHPMTPMALNTPPNLELALKVLAVARLLYPEKGVMIPPHLSGRVERLRASLASGADIVQIDATPRSYETSYSPLYGRRPLDTTTFRQRLDRARKQIESLGYEFVL